MESVNDDLAIWTEAGVDQFVYFAQEADDGPVKIGTARNPVKRLAMLQTGNPRDLQLRVVVPGDSRVEQSLHWRFWEYRLCGEWFSHQEILLAFAAGIRESALAFYRETNVPPAAYLDCHRAIGPLEYELLREKIARGEPVLGLHDSVEQATLQRIVQRRGGIMVKLRR